MRRHPALRLSVLLAAAFVAGAVPSAQTPAELPVGKTASGQTSSDAVAVYRFSAPSAGSLAVAVHSQNDVTLRVTDEDGQALPEGSADRDLFGTAGNEHIIVVLPERGEYRVEVESFSGGGASFEIGAAWIAMTGFARPADPDGRPSRATAVDVGRNHEDSLDAGEGDFWDWFVIAPKASGTLTVILRSVDDNSPDLALELYTGDKLSEHAVRSDDDLQGNTTNESATVDVKAGEKVYVKVLGAVGSASGRYRLASSLIE
jgi:hypothetical protein